MKDRMLEISCRKVLSIVALVVFACVPVFAQDNSDSPRENGRKLEGVWSVTVTTRDCTTGVAGRSFPAMETYARGGTMVEFSVGANTATPVSGRTTSQGVWRYESNGVYSSTFQFFRIGVDGVYAGKTIGTMEINLSDDGNSLTSTQRQQGYDLAGNPLTPRCDSRVATRFE